jgi:hypothetical protein
MRTTDGLEQPAHEAVESFAPIPYTSSSKRRLPRHSRRIRVGLQRSREHDGCRVREREGA